MDASNEIPYVKIIRNVYGENVKQYTKIANYSVMLKATKN